MRKGELGPAVILRHDRCVGGKSSIPVTTMRCGPWCFGDLISSLCVLNTVWICDTLWCCTFSLCRLYIVLCTYIYLGNHIRKNVHPLPNFPSPFPSPFSSSSSSLNWFRFVLTSAKQPQERLTLASGPYFQRSTAQHSTAQHSTAQHSTAQPLAANSPHPAPQSKYIQ